MARRTAAVHVFALPGRRLQAVNRSATVAGGTRLRRRLSKIFQREMRGRRLRCQAPPRVGTNGNSHRRICQSPRTQRRRRRAWARRLEG
jgi:hypothetical protein